MERKPGGRQALRERAVDITQHSLFTGIGMYSFEQVMDLLHLPFVTGAQGRTPCVH